MIAYIHIDDNTAWRMKYDTTDKKWKKVGNGKQDPKNRKLAAGIATLDAKDRQHFLWGYLKIWIDGTDETEGVGKKFLNGKLSGFATKSNTDDYNDIIDDVEDAVGDIEGTEEDFKLHDSEEEIKNIKLGNKEYIRYGPYKLTGIPAGEKLKSFKVVDQDGNDIDFKLQTSISKELKIVNKEKIKNKKKFYICIPKDSNITKFKATIKAPNKKNEVWADIFFLKSENESWQNLVVTQGEKKDKPEGEPLEEVIERDIPGHGRITIQKIDRDDGSPLSGAQFVIWRYYLDPNGGHRWAQVPSGEESYMEYIAPDDARRQYKDGKNTAPEDPNNKWCSRQYVKKTESGYEYVKTSIDDIVDRVYREDGGYDVIAIKDSSYIFTTVSGEIGLDDFEWNGGWWYCASEIKPPDNYKIVPDEQQKKRPDWYIKIVNGGDVNVKYETLVPNDDSTKTTIDLVKVNSLNQAEVINDVKFRFYNDESGWLYGTKETGYRYSMDGPGDTYVTGKDNGKDNGKEQKGDGRIYLEGVKSRGKWTYFEDPDSLPYGYDITNKESGSFQLEESSTKEIKVVNDQVKVRLSGFVWVDQPGDKSQDKTKNNHLFKERTQSFDDNNDLLFDGITVKLKNKDGVVQTTTTGQLNRYTEEGHNGHGEYLFEDVPIQDLENLYIEFEYDGLTYENVLPYNNSEVQKYNKPDKASKAAESTRQEFNNGFSVVEGKKDDPTHGQTRDTGDNVKHQLDYNLNNDEKYTSKLTSQRTI